MDSYHIFTVTSSELPLRVLLVDTGGSNLTHTLCVLGCLSAVAFSQGGGEEGHTEGDRQKIRCEIHIICCGFSAENFCKESVPCAFTLRGCVRMINIIF